MQSVRLGEILQADIYSEDCAQPQTTLLIRIINKPKHRIRNLAETSLVAVCKSSVYALYKAHDGQSVPV